MYARNSIVSAPIPPVTCNRQVLAHHAHAKPTRFPLPSPCAPLLVTPPIDPQAIQTLRELSPDDPAFLRELIDVFLADTPARIGEIEQAMAARDAAVLKRAAHTIKGSAGNFGANDLAAAALELETCGRNADFTEAAARLPALRREFDRVAEALRQYR